MSRSPDSSSRGWSSSGAGSSATRESCSRIPSKNASTAAVCQIEVGGDAIQLQAAANGSLLARRSLHLILAAEAKDLGQ